MVRRGQYNVNSGFNNCNRALFKSKSLAIDQERESLLFWNMLSNEVVLSWLIISLLLHWFQEFLLYNKWKMSFVNKIKKENKEK